jgi:hypothetical protein
MLTKIVFYFDLILNYSGDTNVNFFDPRSLSSKYILVECNGLSFCVHFNWKKVCTCMLVLHTIRSSFH